MLHIFNGYFLSLSLSLSHLPLCLPLRLPLSPLSLPTLSPLHCPIIFSDPDKYPQFSSSTTSGTAVLKASARTYFYQDEHKCDENMENFLKCINAAGQSLLLIA